MLDVEQMMSRGRVPSLYHKAHPFPETLPLLSPTTSSLLSQLLPLSPSLSSSRLLPLPLTYIVSTLHSSERRELILQFLFSLLHLLKLSLQILQLHHTYTHTYMHAYIVTYSIASYYPDLHSHTVTTIDSFSINVLYFHTSLFLIITHIRGTIRKRVHNLYTSYVYNPEHFQLRWVWRKIMLKKEC